MSLLEYLFERERGPVGSFFVRERGGSRKPFWQVMVRLALATAMVAIVGKFARDLLDTVQGERIALGVAIGYLVLAHFVDARPARENMGLAGGLIDHPLKWTDDHNRFLLFVSIVLWPGRFVSDTVRDVAGLFIGARGVTSAQAPPPALSTATRSTATYESLPFDESMAATEWLRKAISPSPSSGDGMLPPGFAAYARIEHPVRKGKRLAGSMPRAVANTLLPYLKEATATDDRCFFAVWSGFSGLRIAPDAAPTLDLKRQRYHVFGAPIESGARSYSADDKVDQLATYWWPADRAWCVTTAIDQTCSYVASSSACISAILSDPHLEASTVTR